MNCSKFYYQEHLLGASVLPTNMCLSFKVWNSCMNKAGLQIGADNSQILLQTYGSGWNKCHVTASKGTAGCMLCSFTRLTLAIGFGTYHTEKQSELTNFLFIDAFFFLPPNVFFYVLGTLVKFHSKCRKGKTKDLSAWLVERCWLGMNTGLWPWMSDCRKRPSCAVVVTFWQYVLFCSSLSEGKDLRPVP